MRLAAYECRGAERAIALFCEGGGTDRDKLCVWPWHGSDERARWEECLFDLTVLALVGVRGARHGCSAGGGDTRLWRVSKVVPGRRGERRSRRCVVVL
jgi:hypothetical protein